MVRSSAHNPHFTAICESIRGVLLVKVSRGIESRISYRTEKPETIIASRSMSSQVEKVKWL